MRFTKMHGLGNDFIVIDGVTKSYEPTPDAIRWLADRRFGVGCDQILIAERATRPEADFRYRIYNPDGSEVEHCGNGVRCLARFLQQRGLAGPGELCFETMNGLSRVNARADGLVTVDMGSPVLAPDAIPFHGGEQAPSYALAVGERHLSIGAVSMGNPHAVVQVPSVDEADVAGLGPLIESHPAFPHRTNAGFMAVVDATRIRLRVYERGAGETMACGTGACAAMVVGRVQGLLGEDVTVELPGGELMVHWSGGDASVQMTGPAVTVFTGETVPPNQ